MKSKKQVTKKTAAARKRDMDRICYAYIDKQNRKAIAERAKEWEVSFSFIVNQLAKKFARQPFQMFDGATPSQIRAMASESKAIRKKI